MKKIFTTLFVAAASAFLCNVATAKPMLMKQVPAASAASPCAPYGNYPTCISVTNLSSYTANVYLPGLALGVYVNPGYAQPIVSNLYYSGLDVMVTNFYGNQVFYVSNRGDFLIPPFSKKIK